MSLLCLFIEDLLYTCPHMLPLNLCSSCESLSHGGGAFVQPSVLIFRVSRFQIYALLLSCIVLD